ALQGGSGSLAELKEPDFDPLRDRDDFRKLVAEMEAKAGPRAKPKDRSPRPAADAPTEGRMIRHQQPSSMRLRSSQGTKLATLCAVGSTEAPDGRLARFGVIDV